MREYLEVNGLEMPDDFGWSDTPQTSKAILEAVLAHDDLSVRDKLSAKLRASSALGDAGGKQSILEVAAFDSSVLTGLTSCLSDLHRSFWLYVKFPEIFDRALDIHYFDCHGGRAQQHDLGVSRRPNISDAALAQPRTVGLLYLVARGGIELPTQGFTILVSNESINNRALIFARAYFS